MRSWYCKTDKQLTKYEWIIVEELGDGEDGYSIQFVSDPTVGVEADNWLAELEDVWEHLDAAYGVDSKSVLTAEQAIQKGIQIRGKQSP